MDAVFVVLLLMVRLPLHATPDCPGTLVSNVVPVSNTFADAYVDAKAAAAVVAPAPVVAVVAVVAAAAAAAAAPPAAAAQHAASHAAPANNMLPPRSSRSCWLNVSRSLCGHFVLAVTAWPLVNAPSLGLSRRSTRYIWLTITSDLN